MYTFRPPNTHPPPPRRRHNTRNMPAGKKPVVKSSRPQRAAAIKARNSYVSSNERRSSTRKPQKSTVQHQPQHQQTPPIHPFKKRMIRAWNDSSSSNKATNSVHLVTHVPHINLPNAKSKIQKPPTTDSPKPRVTPTASDNVPPQKLSQPHKQPPAPPTPPENPKPQPQRRRYPKLISVDKDGRFIANPLKLPHIPTPPPLVLPTKHTLRPPHTRPSPSVPPQKAAPVQPTAHDSPTTPAAHVPVQKASPSERNNRDVIMRDSPSVSVHNASDAEPNSREVPINPGPPAKAQRTPEAEPQNQGVETSPASSARARRAGHAEPKSQDTVIRPVPSARVQEAGQVETKNRDVPIKPGSPVQVQKAARVDANYVDLEMEDPFESPETQQAHRIDATGNGAADVIEKEPSPKPSPDKRRFGASNEPSSTPKLPVVTHDEKSEPMKGSSGATQAMEEKKKCGRKSSVSTRRPVQRCVAIAPMPTFPPGYPTLLPYPTYIHGIPGAHAQGRNSTHGALQQGGVISGTPFGTFSHHANPAQMHHTGSASAIPFAQHYTQAPAQSHGPPGEHPGSRPEAQDREKASSEKKETETVERVIQIGNRCGTQEYWRSSLQMPKSTGVKKAITRPKVRVIERRVSHAAQKEAIPQVETAPTWNPIEAENPVPTAKLFGGEYRGEQANGIRNVRGLADPSATRTPLDVGQHHEFWRKSTKLPSVSSDRARQRRLAAGKRKVFDKKVDSPSTVRLGNQGSVAQQSDDTGPESRDHAMDDSDNAGEAESDSPRHGEERDGDGPTGAKACSTAKHKTPQQFLDEEVEDSKSILKMKEYEVGQMETYVKSRLPMKMNLRGRSKLATWLSNNDTLTSHSVIFLVFMLDLDRRLISKSAKERKQGIEEMENGSLRMLEALMIRLGTRDGYSNWSALTENFNHDE